MEVVYNCEVDGNLPQEVTLDNIKSVEVYSAIGWLFCTSDFTETMNGNKYRFTLVD